jgi:cysteine-rich repeat protein
MRTSAFIVVLAATFVAGCGDSSPSSTASDICSRGAVVDGQSCGAGMICHSNQCVASTCGDGIVADDEECDDGNTVNGDGCDAGCKFTCLSSDSKRNCGVADACAGQGICTDAHVCIASAPLADGHACGAAGNVCSAGVCTSPLCGNGKRDFGEECDDGNTKNLDGCDSACALEQASRITSLVQQFGTDDFCTKNALGGAIPSVAQDFIQSTWSFPVSNGSISIVFKFLGRIDPFGISSTFKLGFVKAAPFRFNPQDDGTFADGYNGNDDLDWWYVRDPASVDAAETPTVQLAGQITNRHLTAGPGTISKLSLLFALQPADVTLYNSKIDAKLDIGVSHPIVSTTGEPPGHLASEHLAPELFEFVSSSSGAMCSDVSVQSLADTLMPGLLTLCADTNDPSGSTPVFFVNPDDPSDPANNHLLDAFIFGCHLFTTDPTTGLPGFQPAFTPTQPDGSRNGAEYVFAFDAVTHQVTSCTKDGQPGTLTDCFANATYSSYFKFAADRVIIHRDPPPSLR